MPLFKQGFQIPFSANGKLPSCVRDVNAVLASRWRHEWPYPSDAVRVMAMNFYKKLIFVLLCCFCACRQHTIIAEEIVATEADSVADSNADTDSDADSESASVHEADTGDSEVGSASDTIRDSDSGTDSGIEDETDTETETLTESGSDTPMDTGSDTDSIENCDVPDAFLWTGRVELVSPDEPAGMIAIKDPTAVIIEKNLHIYATLNVQDETTAGGTRLGMVYLTGTDWSEVTAVQKVATDSNPNLTPYKAAPQLFFFSPRQEWYLVYQIDNQVPAYSTSSDPTDVLSWSAPTEFMDVLPDVEGFGWDYWVICDEMNCFLFFTRANGVLYRAQTTLDAFPDGFRADTTVEVMRDPNVNALYEGCSVYRIAGTEKYLLLVEAFGSNGRYYRSWTSNGLDGEWAVLAADDSNPFVSRNNVGNISDIPECGIEHGELVRRNPDETMTVNTCAMQFMFSCLTRTSVVGVNEYFYYSLGLVDSIQ